MTRADGEPLLIIGASARAAAESARRAGYRPYAIDLFADADLADIAEVRRCRNFPDGLPALARTMPASDWLYVGGLENYPDVVDAIAAERRLLGVSGKALRRIRDPKLFGAAMCMQGVSFPESIFEPAELHRLMPANPPSVSLPAELGPAWDESAWLVKHRRSSAGLGVAALRQADMLNTGCNPFAEGRYLQRRIAGRSMGAVFLATRQATLLLGVSEQLTCPYGDGSHPFRYTGSIGPLPTKQTEEVSLFDKLEKIGGLVTSVFPIAGIFSLDFLLDAGNQIWPLEINPRYTASVELIERAWGRPLVAMHAAACRGEAINPSEELPLPPVSTSLALHGKQIVYAQGPIGPIPAAVTAELLHRRRDAERQGRYAPVADIPRAGSRIAAEEPIATVLASGSDENEVRIGLAAREQELRELIQSAS